jgi:aminobenzoyl-glutamate utilization protein B
MFRAFVLVVMLASALAVSAQKKKGSSNIDQWKKQAASGIQEQYNRYKDIAFTIWDYAELGYKEQKSSALLQQTLKDAGFDVQPGVAG